MAMTGRTPGFVVLYRWRVHAGQEEAFVAAWSTITALLRSQRGSLGSRLHRGSDALWYGYAQWPDAARRQQAFADPVDPVASADARGDRRELSGGRAGSGGGLSRAAGGLTRRVRGREIGNQRRLARARSPTITAAARAPAGSFAASLAPPLATARSHGHCRLPGSRCRHGPAVLRGAGIRGEGALGTALREARARRPDAVAQRTGHVRRAAAAGRRHSGARRLESPGHRSPAPFRRRGRVAGHGSALAQRARAATPWPPSCRYTIPRAIRWNSSRRRQPIEHYGNA